MNPVPLAWKNLTHNLARLALAVAGISFAVVLMFQQRGFNNALFDSTVEILNRMEADAMIVSPKKFTLSAEERFPAEILDVAKSSAEVESVTPVYMEIARARFRIVGQKGRPIRVIAFPAEKRWPLTLDITSEQRKLLSDVDTVLFDEMSKREFRAIKDDQTGKEPRYELSGHHVNVVSDFRLGRDFAHDGNLIMSEQNFVRAFPFRASNPTSIVDFGLLKFRDGVDKKQAVSRLKNQLAPDATVLSKQEYIQQEIAFWARNTPIGIIFGIGSVIGFFVGVFICYNVLASDIAEHMGEFATLKAMGYSDKYFLWLVVRQSFYLSLIGFVPGLGISWIAFQITGGLTGLLMILTLGRVLLIFGITIVMCVLSGLLAVRKLLAADPASLF